MTISYPNHSIVWRLPIAFQVVCIVLTWLTILFLL
jgi:hypothetical protein